MSKKRARIAFVVPALSLVKKDIDSRAISRNRGSSSRESEQSFKAWCRTLGWNCFFFFFFYNFFLFKSFKIALFGTFNINLLKIDMIDQFGCRI